MTTPQKHYFPQNVTTSGNPGSLSSRAYWAINPSGKLIVFVHGFRGDAVKTWIDFPGLLPANPNCAGSDIFYYGYDGAETRADNSAKLLYDFVDDLCFRPAGVINPTLPPGAPPRPANFAYNKITLVAHSLGAVVTRRALLYAHNDKPKRPWLPKVHLVLFAPAHLGSDIVRLYLGTLAIFVPRIGAVENALKLAYPVLIDLEVGSPTLAQLVADVAQATNKGKKNGYLLAKAVIRGTRDRVVTPLPFGTDAAPTVLPGKGHRDVCKPSFLFPVPINELAKRGLL